MTAQSDNNPGSKQASARLQPLSAGLGPRIAALEARVQAVLALTDKVRAALPDPEKNHVLSASYHENELHVGADSGAWCSRIRYRENELRARLIALGERSFTDLKVRVVRPD